MALQQVELMFCKHAALLVTAMFAILQHSRAAPWRKDNAAWNINLEAVHEPHKYYGDWEGHKYHPSPANWRSISIYQLLTDRFADGNPKNNELYEGDFDVRDMTYRHGGDFMGLRQRLNYIKGLGVKAIWISPIFKNGPNSYHMYAMHDFTLIDPRLGTLEELRELTVAAHKLGLYIIVDVVMNHMDNQFAFDGHEKGASPFKMHESEEYRLVLRDQNRSLFQTPAGVQPYEDFWYNNTWDSNATYGGPVYGQYGEAVGDEGTGTYPGCDFHHNGDLKDYSNPWQITLGKIYGTMDDLRLESRRVQDKYIAMTNALISSTDIDGFRIDTPMQVPLEFFKRWAPAVREHAKSLGKNNFALFGEFFVSTARFATMTGRGKVPAMYGKDEYLPGDSTMQGGIDYAYYWYIFTSLVNRRPEFADGVPLVLESENKMLDLIAPATGKKEYAMWTFCNNHDNWRLQAMSGEGQLNLCLSVITFWPGSPLHYAGDEQGLSSPGSALDGWAREELSASMAWRALTVGEFGNPANADNFDMTSKSYLFLQRLNNIRDAYFGNFVEERCDELEFPTTGQPEILAFVRGCTEEDRILVVANFDSDEAKNVTLTAHWPADTVLTDVLSDDDFQVLVGAGGVVTMQLAALEARVLVHEVKMFPPTIVAVSPAHGSTLQDEVWTNITIRFDRPMVMAQALQSLRMDGLELVGAECTVQEQGGCVEVNVVIYDVADGVHTISVNSGIKSVNGGVLPVAFDSTFAMASQSNVFSNDGVFEKPGLICNYLTQLCHIAPGAQWMRMQNMGGQWTQWVPYAEFSDWIAEPGRAVLAQYHVTGSASYIVGDCVLEHGQRCYARYHPEMFLRTEQNKWGMKDEGRMALVNHFTWGVKVNFSGFVRSKFAPFPNWTKSYGILKSRDKYYQLPVYDTRSRTYHPEAFAEGTERVHEWMLERGYWPSDMSLSSSANSAEPIWLNNECSPHPAGVAAFLDRKWKCHTYEQSQDLDWCTAAGEFDGWMYKTNNHSEEMDGCGTCDCCRQRVPSSLNTDNRTCCVLFNDLLLNYTVTSNLSRCIPVEVEPAPAELGVGSLEFSMIFAIIWAIFPCIVAVVGVFRKRQRSVIEIFHAPEELRRPVRSVTAFNKVAGAVQSTLMASPADPPLPATGNEHVTIFRPKQVLFASLEHIIDYEQGRQKAVAGGLGKVAGLLSQYHPGNLICVTACMPGKDYGFATRVGQVEAVVSGQPLTCDVLKYEAAPPSPEDRLEEKVDGSGPDELVYYIVDHKVFRDREDIYPAPQTARKTLEFYSLWCQVVARIIDNVQPDAFHCPDFHAAMAVMYVERHLPVIVVLHNAEYQGAISTQNMGQNEAASLGDVFNLPAARIMNETFIEGKFCMLKPVVEYIRTYQKGYGICAVSRNYALEASQKHSVLWGLPEVRGIENCMPESERVSLPAGIDTDEYLVMRANAKRSVQERFGLKIDPDARMFVFLGRWVKQKGVDYIADVAGWMMRKYPDAQLVMIGPVGDSFGSYARAKLEMLQNSGKHQGNLFVHAGFLEVPPEVKLACDFCLMPSRDEPFGYVDIEFAWFGAAIVGSLKGGLGKLPGFYFQILNADSSSHIQRVLKKTIAAAMACKRKVLTDMSLSSMATEFPVSKWQQELLNIYELSMTKFWRGGSSAAVPSSEESSGFNAAVTRPRDSMPEEWSCPSDVAMAALTDGPEFLRQEPTEAELQRLVDARLSRRRASCANDVLEKVEWKYQISQEKGVLTRALGRSVLGAPLIDWIICLCYMSGPLIPALSLAHVSAQEERYFSLWRPVSEAIALAAWTYLAKAAAPHLVMTFALLARLVPLMLPFLSVQKWLVAIIVGAVAPSDFLFLYYSFMGSSVGDVSRLAMRTGLIMAVRKQWEPLIATLADSPVLFDMWFSTALAVVFVLLPIVALLSAPSLYKVFSIPEISFGWVRKLRFLLFFGVASVLEAFSHTSESAVLVMRQMRPFELPHVQLYCFVLAIAMVIPMVLFGLILRRFPSYAVVIVKAFACCSLPATLLQCWAQAEVETASHLAEELDVVIFTATIVGAVAVYAGAVAILATVGSRWRFVSYTCIVGICSHLARAGSFLLLATLQHEDDVLNAGKSGGLPGPFARRLLMVALPASGAALIFRIMSFFFFEKEATGMLNTSMNRSLARLSGASPEKSRRELGERTPRCAATPRVSSNQQEENEQPTEENGINVVVDSS